MLEAAIALRYETYTDLRTSLAILRGVLFPFQYKYEPGLENNRDPKAAGISQSARYSPPTSGEHSIIQIGIFSS